uniref:peptidylprolyl isomerase n=1 Tax=Calcidiscus leptoporus TaxID=127549 RepID=A0A7S0JHV0_9EUKA
MQRSLSVISLSMLLTATCASNEFGLSFLEKNKDKAGVIALPSGLQYKVLRAGSGADHPAKSSPCECHYEGRTAQEFDKDPTGKNTFDSSYERGSPTTFAPNQVIGGWTEAMQLMVEGDKWELYIPSELAYGDSGQGGDIKPGDVLVFTLHLLEIDGESTPAEPRGPPPYATIESTDELNAWLAQSASRGGGAVLALLRQPLTKGSKLFGGFKRAARAAGGTSSYAVSALSKYDGVSKKFTTSTVESALGLVAPSVHVIRDAVTAEQVRAKGKAAAVACKTGHSRASVSVDDVASAISACVSTAAKEEL